MKSFNLKYICSLIPLNFILYVICSTPKKQTNSRICFLILLFIYFVDASGKVRIWDTVNREHILKAEYQPLGGCVKDIAWSGDSTKIAVCGEGREKYIFLKLLGFVKLKSKSFKR